MSCFLECEQSHLFECFSSLVTTKMSNKGDLVHWRGGNYFLGNEKLGESIMLFLLKSTTLSYTWLLCLLKSSFVTFREGLEDFTVDVQFL